MSVLREVEELVQYLSMRQEVNTLVVLEPLQRVLKDLYEEVEASKERFSSLKDRLRIDYFEVWWVKPFLGWETGELERRIEEWRTYPDRVEKARQDREVKNLDAKKSAWNKK